MHLPVQISHGLGITHSNTIPAMTASVHTITMMPIIKIPSLCKTVPATWERKSRIEHLDMLSASTNKIVEMKTLICTRSRSAEVRKHDFFPRPESTAVDMTMVAPRPHNEAATTITSSDKGRSWRRCDRQRLMILTAVQSACAVD